MYADNLSLGRLIRNNTLIWSRIVDSSVNKPKDFDGDDASTVNKIYQPTQRGCDSKSFNLYINRNLWANTQGFGKFTSQLKSVDNRILMYVHKYLSRQIYWGTHLWITMHRKKVYMKATEFFACWIP